MPIFRGDTGVRVDGLGLLVVFRTGDSFVNCDRGMKVTMWVLGDRTLGAGVRVRVVVVTGLRVVVVALGLVVALGVLLDGMEKFLV
jgi:hypothetical protein